MEKSIRISSLDVNNGISLKLYVGVFPERLLDAVFEKNGDNKKENLALGRVNTVIKGILPDCYTNYVNKSNINDGWVYSYSKDNLDLIKHFLSCWAKQYGLEDNLIDECVKDFDFKPITIDISIEDLHTPNYLKKNLFLFHVSRVLSENLKYELMVKGEKIDLPFAFVNELNKSCKYRLMSNVIEGNVVKRGKPSENNVYYSYYVDLTVDTLIEDSKPKLFINTGIVRFRNIKSKFETKKKNIHPYILVSKSSVHKDCKRNYLKGKIVCRNEKFEDNFSPNWDWFFKECFAFTYEKLPSVEDIFGNPESLIKSDKIKVLIPHGTHFKDTKHEMLQGADVSLRAELTDSVRLALNENIEGVFGEDFIVVETKENRKSGVNSAKILDNPILPINDNGEIDIEVYYLNEEFKHIFQSFIDKYNSGELNVKVPKRKDFSKEEENLLNNLLKDKSNTIVGASQELITLFQPKVVTKEISKSIPDELDIANLKEFIGSLSARVDVKYKFNVHYYSLIDDLKITPEIVDGYSRAKNKATKEKALSEINIALNKNSRAISRNIKKSSKVIPAIVEIMDKKHYTFRSLVDIKPSLRNYFAKNNRITQFCVDTLKKDKNGDVHSSIYNKISKCILECLRGLGVMTVDIDAPLKKNNVEDDSAMIGLYGIPSSENFILTAIYKGSIYGYMAGVSVKWLPIADFLVDIGSKVECKSEINQDVVERAIMRFKDAFSPNHIILVANRNTLKRKIPYFVKMKGDLNLCVKHIDNMQFNAIPIDSSLRDIVSLVAIDEESSGLCPEWVAMENEKENPLSLPAPFCKVNDSVYLGIAKKTNTSNMKLLVNKRKEDCLNEIMRKETAILYSVPMVQERYSKEFVARLVHSLRDRASIQYMSEYTAYPYPLHLAKKSSEYFFGKKVDLLYSSEDIEDMSIEDENIILSSNLSDDVTIETDDAFLQMANILGL